MVAFNSVSSSAHHEDYEGTKYKNYDPSPLEMLSQDASSSPNGGAASQGALGSPSPDGGVSLPAFGEEDHMGDAKKQVISDFHRMYSEASIEDQDAVADKMEAQFADMGLSLKGATDKVFNEGGLQAVAAAEAFGYSPDDDVASPEKLKAREQALSDYGVQADNSVEQKSADQRKQNNRRAMGGFLMDVGLRILASNRQDGGGAIAEGILGTRQARKDEANEAKATARQDELDRQADADRTRQHGREDKADSQADADRTRQHGREDKADSIAEADRKRRHEREDEADRAARMKAQGEREDRKRKAKAQFTNDKGEVFFVDPLDPESVEWVLDEEGNRIKTGESGLSPESIETTRRAVARARGDARAEVVKSMKDDFGADAAYAHIKSEKDPVKKARMIDAAVDDIMVRDGWYQDRSNEISYADL